MIASSSGTTFVKTPPATLAEKTQGASGVVAVVHPKVDSINLSLTPTRPVLTPVMLGSVPVNPRYRTCHGSDSCMTVAELAWQDLDTIVLLEM